MGALSTAKEEPPVNAKKDLIAPTHARLGYNGVAIRDEGDMLSLTNM